MCLLRQLEGAAFRDTGTATKVILVCAVATEGICDFKLTLVIVHNS